MKNLIKIIPLLSIMLIQTSCTVEELETIGGSRIGSDGKVSVRLALSGQTKSAMFDSDNENRISSLTVFVYKAKGGDYANRPLQRPENSYIPPGIGKADYMQLPIWNTSGYLVAEKTFRSTEDMKLDLPVSVADEKLHIYAVANMPDFHGTPDETSFVNSTYKYPAAGSYINGIPMTLGNTFTYYDYVPSEFRPGRTHNVAVKKKGYKPFKSITVTPDGPKSITLNMNKAVARYRFRLDNRVTGLKPLSIRLKQTPLYLTPFKYGYKAESASDVGDGDSGDINDIALCEGQSVSFYCLENMQGDIIPTRPGGGLIPEPTEWDKVPRNCVNGDKCSYLEMTGFMDGSLDGKIGEVTYRFYLGKDNIKNYDVERNTSYEIVLTVTEDGLGVKSWKITDERADFAAKGEIYMAQRLNYSIAPASGTTLSLAPGSILTDDGKVRIRPLINASAKVVGCEVSAYAPGVSTVYVKQGGTVDKTFDITVKAPLLHCDKAVLPLTVDGTSKNLRISYADPDSGEPLSKSIFDKTLYENLLECTATSSSSNFTIIRDRWNKDMFETYIGSIGGISSASQLSATATVRAASPHIVPMDIALTALEPFPANAGGDKGKLFFSALDKDGYNWQHISLPINAPTVKAELYPGATTSGVPLSNSHISYSPSTGHMSIGFPYRKPFSGGKHTVKLVLTNFRSGEKWENSRCTFSFTKIVNLYICGEVTITTGSDGHPYAHVRAVSATNYFWPSVRIARKGGGKYEQGSLGSVIYKDMLEEPISVERYKNSHRGGPEFVIVKEVKGYPRYSMPVMFDDAYMEANGSYIRYCKGGWID